ncbi:MAG: DUF5106 domain-containing protein [Rikenellaceae bacterium]|nr:DUF5106 domain-containing protein [Rikenellaceae bacterium]
MKRLLLFLSLFLVVSCLGRSGGGTQAEPPRPGKIVIPAIPSVIVTDGEKAEYLAVHYWDNFDFADTTYISLPEITEQAFVDYLMVLSVVPPEVARRGVDAVVSRSADTRQMYDHFTDLFEKYLDDPNSPFRNEELYIPVLESIIASPKVDELDKLRPQAQLTAALKNRVGTRAADFTATDAQGRKVRLYDIDSEYTLLYFNNPDCNYCEEVTRTIRESENLLMPLVRQGVLKIIAVYPDEDLAAWRAHLDDMPAEWLRTYDATLEIRNGHIYDLRAIPSLYLLGRDKTVLMKDVDKVVLIENFFARQGY